MLLQNASYTRILKFCIKQFRDQPAAHQSHSFSLCNLVSDFNLRLHFLTNYQTSTQPAIELCSIRKLLHNLLLSYNNIKSVILKIKTKDLKLLKYLYLVLFPENIFKENKIFKTKDLNMVV